MSKAILGKKLGMFRSLLKKAHLIPVTVIEVLPNVVVGVKTVDKRRIQRRSAGLWCCQGKTSDKTRKRSV